LRIMRRTPHRTRLLSLATCALAAMPLLLTGCVSNVLSNRAAIARERQAAQDPRAMVHIGDAARDQGDLKTAVSFYGRAAALRPQDPAYVTPYAETLAATGELGQAMAVIRQARTGADAQSDLRFIVLQARLLTSSQRPLDAIAILTPAIARHPDSATLQIGLGIALDNTRDFTHAQAAYQRALALDPSSLAAENNLELSIALGGNPQEALTGLDRLRNKAVGRGASDATLATIDGNLAIVYALLGDLPNARRVGMGAVANTRELRDNDRFYSLLAPTDSGAPDRSGLSATPD
jgi:Flp pilus assembly protein TadD